MARFKKLLLGIVCIAALILIASRNYLFPAKLTVKTTEAALRDISQTISYAGAIDSPRRVKIGSEMALSAVLQLVRLLRRPSRPASGVLDQVYKQLLADFSAQRRNAVESFFDDVRSGQGLVGQITPSGMEVFNASTQDRPGVRYGCVVSRARPPGQRSLVKAGLDPYAQATHALFAGLYRVASGSPRRWLPPMTAAQAGVLRRAYGRVPDGKANDGIVPTLSQVWGQVIHATVADHLDALGHFRDASHDPPHVD